MVFSSPIFLFYFFPTCLVFYFITIKFFDVKIQNICLLIFSLIFYAYGGFSFLPVLLLSIFINYLFALLIESYKTEEKFCKHLLFLAVFFNLSILFVFKYLNLYRGFLNYLFKFIFVAEADELIQKIMLPIGISFYTFQILSYILDVYRGEVKANKKFYQVCLYALLFPQLIAGPIVRYKEVADRFDKRDVNFDKIYNGLKRFIVGFIKKILIANHLGKVADLALRQEPFEIGSFLALLGIICYSIQIYIDFYAYSDMAIGIGQIFGFDFPENFNHPFISKSVTEFWRRWHITLSSFFRDYLYIPLGGSQKTMLRTCINLFIVFSLSGFWHGASYNFLLWGMYNAVFLIIERLYLGKILKRIPSFISIIYTDMIWVFGMILFYFENLNNSFNFFLTIFSKPSFTMYNRDLLDVVYNNYFLIVFIIAFLLCTPIFDNIKKLIDRFEKKFIINWILDLCLIFVFVFAVSEMIANGYNPFIYFRF